MLKRDLTHVDIATYEDVVCCRICCASYTAGGCNHDKFDDGVSLWTGGEMQPMWLALLGTLWRNVADVVGFIMKQI